MVCPAHKCALERKHTRYGGRWGCTYPGCTVVCWEGSTSTPADDETRTLRNQCHRRFDPLWKSGEGSPFSGEPGGKQTRRSRAYVWLSEVMGLSVSQTHFGMFSADQCRKALAALDAIAPQMEVAQ